MNRMMSWILLAAVQLLVAELYADWQDLSHVAIWVGLMMVSLNQAFK